MGSFPVSGIAQQTLLPHEDPYASHNLLYDGTASYLREERESGWARAMRAGSGARES